MLYGIIFFLLIQPQLSLATATHKKRRISFSLGRKKKSIKSQSNYFSSSYQNTRLSIEMYKNLTLLLAKKKKNLTAFQLLFLLVPSRMIKDTGKWRFFFFGWNVLKVRSLLNTAHKKSKRESEKFFHKICFTRCDAHTPERKYLTHACSLPKVVK